MKKTLTQLFLLTIGFQATAQVTSIPDPIFEQVLIDMEIDSDGTVNGQMATADALNVVSLTITSPNPDQMIYDLTGIDAFVDLEELNVNFTMIEELNVSSLSNLKHLNCMDNLLTGLNVSNNPSLEYLDITSGGDVYPFNAFSEIDLSNNPNIHTLIATGNMELINLRNGNNNPNMHIDISSSNWDLPPDVIVGHTCIEVDDALAAQNSEPPYSEWAIFHSNQSYSFAEDCNLSNPDIELSQPISVYPNPVSNVLYVRTKDDVVPEKVRLYDVSGRLVREYSDVSGGSISVTGLAKGMYILKVIAGKRNYSERIIVE